MTLSRDRLARLTRLRELFLAERPPGAAIADYWRTADDLAAYDAVFAARIGWKWDAALHELRDRGFARADDEVVLDYGCGSGIAARRFVHWFGAREVVCHDRSTAATMFAVRALQAAAPQVAARPLHRLDELRPDVLLVSHVLAELDARGEQQLRALIARSRRVVLLEPGNKAVARRLSALRDSLLDRFHVVAPCPHAGSCPALAKDGDWCHFFAAPPPEVFTDGNWVRTTKALGIDARALPYAFLGLVHGPAPGAAPRPPRLVGRPEVHPHVARVQGCTAQGLRTFELGKRLQPALWKALKKHPESVRDLPG